MGMSFTLPTALAAPVDAGMTLALALRPARQSLPPREGPSTVSLTQCVGEGGKKEYTCE